MADRRSLSPKLSTRGISEVAGPALTQGGQILIYAGIFALCVLNLSKATFNPFIYFQF